MSHAGEQASFDCTKATTVVEKAICADPALGAADRALAEAYQAASARLSDEGRSGLRDEQRQWLKRLWQVCGEATPAGGCVANEYRMRQKGLQTVAASYGSVTIRRAQIFDMLKASNTDEGTEGRIGMAPRYPGYAIRDIDYPQIDNPRTNADRLFNAAMKSLAIKGDDNEEDGADLTSGFEVVSVSPFMIAIRFEDTTYGHGSAHPWPQSFMFNWVVTEGRKLKPEDVFAEGPGWRKLLADRCFAGLPEDHDQNITTADEMQNKAVEPDRWQFGKDGLTIHFDVYEVGPYTAGMSDILIPWADLKPYLTPAGAALAR